MQSNSPEEKKEAAKRAMLVEYYKELLEAFYSCSMVLYLLITILIII
jgi:hypothetical protein